jgi:tRNA-specific 2-thiouridylase
VKIDAGTNTVVVGDEHALYGRELRAHPVNWISVPSLEGHLRCSAKIRYKHDEAPCTISPLESGAVRAKFDEPQRAITPGQAVVFYDGDTVLGGGWIEADLRHQTSDT